MKFSDISRIAIVTLRSHAIESKKQNPIIKEPIVEYCSPRNVHKGLKS